MDQTRTSHLLKTRFLESSSYGQIILYLKKANGGIVWRFIGAYKARRIFFARIVGHDYIVRHS
jgi:hypothetical protein